jgi:bile acid:Na+ symporter, BASS family
VKLLLPIAVFLLMISIGMSLHPGDLLQHWRRMIGGNGFRLLLATFIVPPAVALLLYHALPLDFGEGVGLFMLGVVPGAPLVSRIAAKRGFDMQLAASYQLWSAVLVPVMLPLVVYAAARLYDRNVWISPWVLLKNIAENQFAPLLIGLVLMYFVPVFSARIQPAITVIGNVLLLVMIAAVLWVMRGELAAITVWLFVASVLLAVASILAITLLVRTDVETVKTLALCNANRYVGLALLISREYTRSRHAVPAIACYALIAPVIMVIYARIVRRRTALRALA